MSDESVRGDGSRALVLGVGGLVGIAWETGYVAGLAAGGVDLRTADLIIGTSAGSTVATQIATCDDLAALYEQCLSGDPGSEPKIDLDLVALREQLLGLLNSADTPDDARRAVGELATSFDRVPESERTAIVAARFAAREWPAANLKIVAIDAGSGAVATFDRHSGVSLLDAVTASCAIPVVWPAATIGDRRYIDGGMRSATNADLAMGYGRVLVFEPAVFPEMADVASLGPESEVMTIRPDGGSAEAMSGDPLDPTARPACARDGFRQATEEFEQVSSFWLRAV